MYNTGKNRYLRKKIQNCMYVMIKTIQTFICYFSKEEIDGQ